MNCIKLVLLGFICVAKSYGQPVAKNHYGRIDVTFIKEKRPKKFYAKVEIKSGFPGGDSAWVRSIEKNITQSIGDGRRVKKGTYTVSVKFIADRNGSLSDIVCENDPGFGMYEKVFHVLKKTTKWIPARQLK